MTHALLYHPKQNWRTAVAFVAALLIHFAAIAIAATQHDVSVEPPPGESDSGPVDLIDPPPADESTPPPDPLEAPPDPIAPDPSLFPEERSTPPPVHRQPNRPSVPLVRTRPGVSSGSPSSSARIMALSAPRPEYPYEARRQKVTGSGVAAMTVDPVTGNVTSVVMERSTGNPALDNAAVAAFRKWRFKPGTVAKVKSPVTFTIAGALY